MTTSTSEVINLLKTRGYKITPQRIAIFKYLKGNYNHPSSEEIYNDIKVDMPTISHATVYKTLSMLVEIGVVRELSFGNNQNRYDTNVGAHVNIICPECNTISDYHSSMVADFVSNLRNELGDLVDVPRIDISKKCEQCSIK